MSRRVPDHPSRRVLESSCVKSRRDRACNVSRRLSGHRTTFGTTSSRIIASVARPSAEARSVMTAAPTVRCGVDCWSVYCCFAGATTYTYSNSSFPGFDTLWRVGGRDIGERSSDESRLRLAIDQCLTLAVRMTEGSLFLPVVCQPTVAPGLRRTKPLRIPANATLQRERDRDP